MNSTLEIAADGRKVFLLDYLKGFSIATIVLMHFLSFSQSMPQKILTLSAIGGTGVHVFFLCSGIGLYFSHLHRRLSWTEFLRKRFLKIYIPYVLIVFISFLLPWMYEGDDRVTALLSHVFLFKMFVPGYTESFGVQFWFVSTLFQLYAVFLPLCALKEKLKNDKLFFGIFLGISVFWWIFCYYMGISQIRIWGSFFLQYIWEFALGLILAEAFHKGKNFRIKHRNLLILAVGGIGLQAGLAMFSDSLKIFNDIPGLIGYASLALLFSCIPFVRKLCVTVSSFSYALYLVHILIIATVFYFVRPQGFLMELFWMAVSTLLSLAAAQCYHRITKKITAKPAAGRQ